MPDQIQFGKYLLLRPLAEGGMASIHLAKAIGPEGFQKDVVVKRVLPQYSKDPDFVQMFLEEARVSARMSHPNIVQVFDFGQAEGSYYLAMEYLAGEDLRSIKRHVTTKGKFIPFEVAAAAICGACAGLHYAHSLVDERGRGLSIVHRDVSPSNVLVTYQGFVKVLDFGIAKMRGKAHETEVGVRKGKYMYMSPEQAGGLPLDRRSDVFSLGIVLYELITHETLFRRDSDMATIRAVLEGPIKAPRGVRPDLPAGLEDIAMTALQRDPAKRFQNAAEMQRALERVIGAHTNVPQQELLRAFLVETFGEDYVQKRSRPPSAEGESKDWSAATIEVSPSPEIVDLIAAAKGNGDLEKSTRASARLLMPELSAVSRRIRYLLIVVAIVIACGLGFGLRQLSKTGPEEVEAMASHSPMRDRNMPASTLSVREGPAPSPPPPAVLPPIKDAPPEATLPAATKSASGPAKSASHSQPGQALRVRFGRVKSAWLAQRSSRSEEDAALWDHAIAIIETKLRKSDSQSLGEAKESLNEFVSGALRGQEP
jgi:serine/threonine protein kinase